MAKQNRSTLKSFFGDGAVPTSSMFRDLVDSTINLHDDGFEKNNRDGVKIFCHSDSRALTSYYHQQQRDLAVWRVAFEGEHSNLLWSTQAQIQSGIEINEKESAKLQEALCLSRRDNQLRVGVGTQKPQTTLDVNGCIHSLERRGSYGRSFESVPADGQWKTIVDDIQGGSAFEVVARAQNLVKRRYALIHAIALHCPWKPKSNDLLSWLGIRNRIKYTQVFHDSLLHKIKLQWEDKDAKNGYKLQIRTNCDYGTELNSSDGFTTTEPCVIDFHITRLWSDEDTFVTLADQAKEGLGDD